MSTLMLGCQYTFYHDVIMCVKPLSVSVCGMEANEEKKEGNDK